MREQDDADADLWVESTEGDLDPDLTEEAGSSLDDWERPFEDRPGISVARIAIGLALVALVLSLVLRALV
ncbi:MAG: hypothetical protein WD734_03205 [Dehalococcoidia bacterium]